MRVETEASRKDVENPRASVWLTPTEFETLVDCAETIERKLAILIGGRCGLRSFELTQITPWGIRRSEDRQHYFIRVPEGKDTSGSGGKARDAYLSSEVEAQLDIYVDSNDIRDNEPIFDVTPRTIQNWVRWTAEAARVETGDDDWQYVSSHDLRRYIGQQILSENRMNPRVAMAVGGWGDLQALKPYLNSPSESAIVSEFERIGW